MTEYSLLERTLADNLSWNRARIKFLALNLDYSIDKARRLLGYDPPTEFSDAMRTTVAWRQSLPKYSNLSPCRSWPSRPP